MYLSNEQRVSRNPLHRLKQEACQVESPTLRIICCLRQGTAKGGIPSNVPIESFAGLSVLRAIPQVWDFKLWQLDNHSWLVVVVRGKEGRPQCSCSRRLPRTPCFRLSAPESRQRRARVCYAEVPALQPARRARVSVEGVLCRCARW